MTPVGTPSPAEVEHADWPALKAFAADLGLNPKGRSAIVRQRVLDRLRAQGKPPEWRAGRGEQAALLTRLGSAGAAVKLWESTITLETPAPWVGLGTAYLRSGATEEAMKSFDRAVLMGDRAARFHRAHALLQAGEGDRALAELEEAIAARPEDVRAWALRASFADATRRLDERMASHARLAELGRGHLGLARALMKAGRFEEAEKALDAHLARHGGDSVAWSNLGACRARRGRWPEALDAFRKAAALSPHDAGVLNNLAVALAATGKLDDAIKRIQHARRIAEDPRILSNEATLLERRRSPAAAREIAAKVLAAEPAQAGTGRGKRRVAPKRRTARAPAKPAKTTPLRAPRRKPARARSARRTRTKKTPEVRRPRRTSPRKRPSRKRRR